VSSPSKVCAQCGRLCAKEDVRCSRCGERFPGKLGAFFSQLGPEFTQGAPMVTLYVAICSVVFVCISFAGGKLWLFSNPPTSELLRWGLLHPLLVWSEPWRLMSAVFVHLGVLHMLMNMSALVSLGVGIERSLGSVRFALVFLSTGVLGFVASTAWGYWGLGALAPTAGASGGLFGLVGFEVGYLYRARDPRWKQALTRAVIGAAILGFLMPVNNAAHAGGGLVGMLWGYWSYKETMWRRYAWFWRALAGGLVGLSLLSIVLCHVSDVWRGTRAAEMSRGMWDD
jgi:rhomboid protease GluP